MTVTPQDIDAAVLSLDSYDVGDAPSLYINLKEGDLIGNFKVLLVSDEVENTDHSFVAVAYQDQTSGKIIISYRGTDAISLNPSDDVFQGWSVGAGEILDNQAPLAIQFYEDVVKQVTGLTSFSIFDAKPETGLLNGGTVPLDIELTGHSLGGGLAGLVGALSGDQAIVFDHMPFGAAAYKFAANYYASEIALNPALLAILGLGGSSALTLIQETISAAPPTLLKLLVDTLIPGFGTTIVSQAADTHGYFIPGEINTFPRGVNLLGVFGAQGAAVEAGMTNTAVASDGWDDPDVFTHRHSMGVLTQMLWAETGQER